MAAPRSVDDGLKWFLSHNPSKRGMCAQHTRNSLGGDYGNPPMWGAPDANAVYDKIVKSGHYWRTPRRGDIVVWKYGNHGHAARVYSVDGGKVKIATTDPRDRTKMVGIEDLSYPERWGASPRRRVFTNEFAGVVCFPRGGAPAVTTASAAKDPFPDGEVYLDRLRYGNNDSDSVKRLQVVLNAHKMDGSERLSINGDYDDLTDDMVRLCQRLHGFGSDADDESNVGPQQADHLFKGSGNKIIK